MIRNFFILLFILPLAACWEKPVGVQFEDYEQLFVRNAEGDEHQFTVILAVTQQQQTQGLMHVTDLAEDAGMLFVFNKEAERSFWMKNTYIPLDIIFVRKDGAIHHIHENAKPGDLTSIRSQGPVAAVLEINAGLSQKLGFSKGDEVKHGFFGNN